jgi:hypothetical protein
MTQDIMMGLFGFLIAIVSLYRIMSDQEFYRLTMMKKNFGRKNGLVCHFVVSVALPILLGIVFLTGGVTGKPLSVPLQANDLPIMNVGNPNDFEEDWLKLPV